MEDLIWMVVGLIVFGVSALGKITKEKSPQSGSSGQRPDAARERRPRLRRKKIGGEEAVAPPPPAATPRTTLSNFANRDAQTDLEETGPAASRTTASRKKKAQYMQQFLKRRDLRQMVIAREILSRPRAYDI